MGGLYVLLISKGSLDFCSVLFETLMSSCSSEQLLTCAGSELQLLSCAFSCSKCTLGYFLGTAQVTAALSVLAQPNHINILTDEEFGKQKKKTRKLANPYLHNAKSHIYQLKQKHGIHKIITSVT